MFCKCCMDEFDPRDPARNHTQQVLSGYCLHCVDFECNVKKGTCAVTEAMASYTDRQTPGGW